MKPLALSVFVLLVLLFPYHSPYIAENQFFPPPYDILTPAILRDINTFYIHRKPLYKIAYKVFVAGPQWDNNMNHRRPRYLCRHYYRYQT